MSKFIFLFTFFLQLQSLAIAQAPEENHKQPQITETINGANVYGEKWQDSNNKIEIKLALSSATDYVGKETVFTGNISKVCQKAGCWMILEQDGEFARVDFNNHAFFIPKDSLGSAEVFGKLSLKQMSQKQKQHLESEGAGNLPEKVYEIIATSVKINP
jgi:hypothetical protein